MTFERLNISPSSVSPQTPATPYVPLIFRCLSILMSSFLVISCDNYISDYTNDANHLMPLNVGNYWIYIKEVNGFPGLTDTARIAITETADINYEGDRYRVGFWNKFLPGTNQPLDYKWLLWNGPDGLYNMGGISNTDTLITKILFLKYPSYAGENWDAFNIGYDLLNNAFIITDTINYTCIATNELFETPVRNFKCYVFYWREKPEPDVKEEWLHYMYYAPNFGYVGEIVKSSLNNSVKFKIYLTEYSLNDQLP